MQQSEIMKIVEGVIPNAQVSLEGEDCSFSISVVSDKFENMRPVARQQMVLSGFTELLRTGELHALSVKAFTPEEWKQSQQLVSIL